MVKGRANIGKHSERKIHRSMKARTRESKESIKKVTGKPAIEAPGENLAVESPGKGAPSPASKKAKDELKLLARILKRLQSEADGMHVLTSLLDATHKKKLVTLMTETSSPPVGEEKQQSALKRSEALLRSLHTRERQVVEVVHSVLLVLDADLTIRMISRSGCKLLGYDEAELIGKRWTDEFVSKSRVATVHTILHQALSGSLEGEYEYPVATRSGEERILSWRSTVLRDASGITTGLVCSGEDLTMIRQMNAALERSEDRLHLMMDSVGEDEFFITDADGYIVSWIARSKDGRNYRAEEMIGRHFSCLYSPDDFQAGKPMRILATAQNTGRYEEDGWRVRKDGTRSRAYVIVTAIKDNEQHLLGFSNVTRYVVEPAEASAKRLFPLAVPITEFP